MNFSTASNITLSDSISGYVTADEGDEDADNTHYLSVLSEDMSLDGMNLTLCNSQEDNNDETQFVEVASEDVGQPFIFTIDGSDEIYGVQIAHDEDGNLQKYQIQYSENMNGELVPMLETIQILSLDDEASRNDSVTPTNNKPHESEEVEQTIENSDSILIEQEHGLDAESDEEFSMEEDTELDENVENPENINCKPGISSKFSFDDAISVKQESSDLFIETSEYEPVNETPDNYASGNNEVNDEFEMPHVNLKVENLHDAFVEIQVDEHNIMPSEQFEINSAVGKKQEQSKAVENIEQHFEQLFVEENHITENDRILDNGVMNETDSENDMYHIVDGMHITGDIENENSFQQPFQAILKETMEHHSKTNILRKHVSKGTLKYQSNVNESDLHIQTLREKENMEVLEVRRSPKPNSRSLLKCNQLSPSQATVTDPLHVEVILEDKYSKRYSRTKEAKQARQFINFINSTTIPQVPERKERLPRKQQIKPVKHQNEDIVVKEMIVSSNGFIEPISAEEKKYLPVTEYVELLDSGDECNSAGTGNKKKRNPKTQEQPIEIEISDSEDSNISVMALDLQMNDCVEEKNDSKIKNKIAKKKRGRPKNKNIGNDKKDSDSNSESPPKISRTESDVESVTSSLQVIRVQNESIDKNSDEICEHVSTEINDSSSRTVPAVSLKIMKDCSGKNEIEYHIEECSTNIDSYKNETQSVERSNEVKDLALSINKPETKPAIEEVQSKRGFEYKHECEKCKTKFINKFLLLRHNCIIKSGLPFSCDFCQRKFPNTTSLNVHKKIHTQESTAVKRESTKIPQVKAIPKSTGAIPRSTSRNSVAFTKYSTGSSVKNPKPQNEKKPVTNSGPILSNPSQAKSKITQSNFLKPKAAETTVTPDKASKSNVFKFERQCDQCPMRFDNNASWFDHQVLEHGLKTPDKTIREKKPKKLVKAIVVHNGINARPAVAKNLSVLRSRKMEQLQSIK